MQYLRTSSASESMDLLDCNPLKSTVDLSPCLQVSGGVAGSLASSSTPSTSSRQYTRQRITRVNLRDLIFYMEQEKETAHSLLLYRALLK